jgi:hypothetical protein
MFVKAQEALQAAPFMAQLGLLKEALADHKELGAVGEFLF